MKINKKYKTNPILLLSFLILGIMYGIIMHEFEVFPYKLVRSTFHIILGSKPDQKIPLTKENSNFYDLWSIGIYEGTDPFDLTSAKNIQNPILSAKDVIDINTSYIADPFMVIDDTNFFVFFEAFNWDTGQGDIAYAKSTDLQNWEYQKVVIDEQFHLSYPYIFEWQDDYYMIPESQEDLAVRLYIATSFPDKWEYIGNLISGYHFIDPSIVYYNNLWWLFVAAVPDDGVVNLYYSDNLLDGWVAHPMNPIIKLDKHIARPAGRLFVYNDNIYRLAQDCYIEYGQQVFAFEITELSKTTYAEKIVSEKPLVTRSGNGWNAAGMHHVDLHRIGDKWIAVADGKKYIGNSNISQPPKKH